jgi:hypothetical protein
MSILFCRVAVGAPDAPERKYRGVAERVTNLDQWPCFSGLRALAAIHKTVD